MPRLGLADQLDAVHARQAPFRQQQIYVLGLEGLERLLGAVGHQDLVALQLEGAAQGPEEHLVVLDQQEPPLHAPPPATA